MTPHALAVLLPARPPSVLSTGAALRAEPTSVAEVATSGAAVILAIAAALVAALVLAEVAAAVVRALGRRTWLADNLARRARRPLRVVLVVVAVWVGLRLVTRDGVPGWRPPVEHVLLVALIVSGTWLVGALAFVVEDAALARYRTDTPDNRHARRVRTQIMVLRRLTVAVLVLCAVAGVLLTFDGARAAGAGVLASAGLLSVVAGLAAQTSLANVFAGLQLAFTDAIRVDDVVVVEGEWGRIEEITMTYVVVHVWDDRRLIMPSTYFTTTPFQNWTRRAADLLGTVEIDLDWAVPVGPMRAELTRLLQESELWDHRVGVLQVTEATGGYVRVRALASAADAPTLFDLRCAVREGLVAWLQREHPEALPRTRFERLGSDGADGAPAPADHPRGAHREPATPSPAAAPDLPAPPDAPADPDASRPVDPDATELLPPVPAEGAAAVRRRSALARGERAAPDAAGDSRLFTGSIWAVERSKAFSGPGDDVIAEREHTAEGLRPPATGEVARAPRGEPSGEEG